MLKCFFSRLFYSFFSPDAVNNFFLIELRTNKTPLLAKICYKVSGSNHSDGLDAMWSEHLILSSLDIVIIGVIMIASF